MSTEFTTCQSLEIADCLADGWQAAGTELKDYACEPGSDENRDPSPSLRGTNDPAGRFSRVLEICNHPWMLTSPEPVAYNGTQGYCGTHWPAYLTIDLGKNRDLGVIMFLLWDHGEDYNHGDAERRYFYRLLVAEDYTQGHGKAAKIVDRDNIEWKVIYDSGHQGYRNWQIFNIRGGIKARFIRIHCLRNPKNSGFHVVRLKAFGTEVGKWLDEGKIRKQLREPKEYPVMRADGSIERKEQKVKDPAGLSQYIVLDPTAHPPVTEVGDGVPLSKRLYDISNVINQVARRGVASDLAFEVPGNKLVGINQTVLDVISKSKGKRQLKIVFPRVWKSRFQKVYTIDPAGAVHIVRSIADDIEAVERNADGIERIVVTPMNLKMKSSNLANIAGLAIAAIFTIYSLVTLIRTYAGEEARVHAPQEEKR